MAGFLQPVPIILEKFVSNRAPPGASVLFPPLPGPRFPRQLLSPSEAVVASGGGR